MSKKCSYNDNLILFITLLRVSVCCCSVLLFVHDLFLLFLQFLHVLVTSIFLVLVRTCTSTGMYRIACLENINGTLYMSLA